VNAGWTVPITEEPLADVIERAKTGCRDAFDDLISRFEGKVLKTALYLTRNMDEAQDIAQEVYVKIFRNIHMCKDPDRIESWVYRITVNTVRDFQGRKRLFLPLAAIVKVLRPHDPVIRDEIRTRLTEALDLLSFNEKTTFVLKVLEEMDTADVAEILGCRAVTVRSYLHGARKKLQDHFRDFRGALWTD
jgi:RNA polymerase sigma-70 factor (ECF subfamily)